MIFVSTLRKVRRRCRRLVAAAAAATLLSAGGVSVHEHPEGLIARTVGSISALLAGDAAPIGSEGIHP